MIIIPRNICILYNSLPTGTRNHGRPLKILLDTWDRNGSTSGPTPWKIYDDDDDDDKLTSTKLILVLLYSGINVKIVMLYEISKVTVTINVKWCRYRPGLVQRVGRGIALLLHDLGTRRGWVVSSMPRPHFTPGKDTVPIVQEAAWAPGSVWTGGKSRPHRDSIPDRTARSQSLYRLSYRAHNSNNSIVNCIFYLRKVINMKMAHNWRRNMTLNETM